MYMKKHLLQRADSIMVSIALALKLFLLPKRVKPVYRKKSQLCKFVSRAASSIYTKVLQPIISCLEDQVCRMTPSRIQNVATSDKTGLGAFLESNRFLGRSFTLVSTYIFIPVRKRCLLLKVCILAMHSEMEGNVETDKGPPSFDANSDEIGIDNRASYSMSHQKEDFGGEIKMTNQRIRGIAGTLLTRIGYGTLLWKIEEDTGRSHDI